MEIQYVTLFFITIHTIQSMCQMICRCLGLCPKEFIMLKFDDGFNIREIYSTLGESTGKEMHK